MIFTLPVIPRTDVAKWFVLLLGQAWMNIILSDFTVKEIWGTLFSLFPFQYIPTHSCIVKIPQMYPKYLDIISPRQPDKNNTCRAVYFIISPLFINNIKIDKNTYKTRQEKREGEPNSILRKHKHYKNNIKHQTFKKENMYNI